ncbi:MAG TPA: helix-turn-helix domain-containing protein [Methylophilaceae bacterium]|nr:helix-turn-helix domain-containing protein [Methylophilaceae bacterium]
MQILHQDVKKDWQPKSGLLSYQSTADFEEQAALLQGWNQDYAQLSSGSFTGYVSEMRFDDVHLFLEFSSQHLFQNGKLPDDIIAVGVPLEFTSNGLFCGTACDTESMHIFSGEHGFEFFSPTDLLMGGISVKRETLFDALTDEEQSIASQHCSYAHLLHMESDKTKALRNFMGGAFEMVRHNPALLENNSTRESLNKSVISLLTDALVDHSSLAYRPISNAKCWNIIGETRALVHQYSENPISVAEVCQQLGISRRTLQYCFQNLLNTSPVAYLRAERLNNVRRMLRSANSVTEAAAHWGFWHFGHFSQEYKKMFGELPSATFKRLHTLN